MGERTGRQIREVAQASVTPVLSLLIFQSESRDRAIWLGTGRRFQEDAFNRGSIAVLIQVPEQVTRDQLAKVLAALSDDCASLEILRDVDIRAELYTDLGDMAHSGGAFGLVPPNE